ncbi:hypothetical protein ABZ260_50775, partial [Streptosporangium sp. NPDC006013]|uniref:hypothetical protein n=1 Tax=Streptosporangium sp. NPDC006013 TaxID=3155596 RepID=UPI0033AA7CAD
MANRLMLGWGPGLTEETAAPGCPVAGGAPPVPGPARAGPAGVRPARTTAPVGTDVMKTAIVAIEDTRFYE